jgi:hypothetical protein
MVQLGARESVAGLRRLVSPLVGMIYGDEPSRITALKGWVNRLPKAPSSSDFGSVVTKLLQFMYLITNQF